MQWYYAIDGQRLGPVHQTEFERLVRAGTVTPGTLVWRKPMAGWQSLADVLAADPSAVATTEPDVPPLPEATTEGSVEMNTAAVGVPGVSPGVLPNGIRITEAAPLVYGGFWRRVLARLIDWLILGFSGQMVISLIGTAFFQDTVTMMEKIKGKEPTPEQAVAIVGFLGMALGVSLVLGVLYDCIFLRKYSATPGKLALGLAVCRSDGSPLSLGRIIGRYFAVALNGFTFGLTYLIVAFDDQKRGIHDSICDTRVVRTNQ